LLATRLEEAPSTIWIWDLATAELRAVLMFHSSADFAWHPSIRELLLVVCHDEGHTAVPFVWDPLSNGPTCIPVIERLSQSGGKVQATWVAWNHELPALLLSDPHSYFVVSPSDTEHGPAFWKEDIESDSSISFSDHGLSYLGRDATASGSLIGDDTYPLEDTFSFKYGRDQ
jgi:hypothetical protein